MAKMYHAGGMEPTYEMRGRCACGGYSATQREICSKRQTPVKKITLNPKLKRSNVSSWCGSSPSSQVSSMYLQ